MLHLHISYNIVLQDGKRRKDDDENEGSENGEKENEEGENEETEEPGSPNVKEEKKDEEKKKKDDEEEDEGDETKEEKAVRPSVSTSYSWALYIGKQMLKSLIRRGCFIQSLACRGYFI